MAFSEACRQGFSPSSPVSSPPSLANAGLHLEISKMGAFAPIGMKIWGDLEPVRGA